MTWRDGMGGSVTCRKTSSNVELVPRQLCHNFNQRVLDTCHFHFIILWGLSGAEACHGRWGQGRAGDSILRDWR